MFVASLAFKNWRGTSFRMGFAPTVTVMVGLNGCGKTNTLELIAILAGHDDAKHLIRPTDNPSYVKIEVRWKTGSSTLELTDGLDPQKIAEFKAGLPTRVSFVLQTDLPDDYLVTERREPVECQKDLLRWLENYDMPVNMHFNMGHSASCLVSETGAQRTLLTTGMRRAPEHTPMLVEHPERSLHVILRRSIHEFYLEGPKQQLILTTHCPEVCAIVDRVNYRHADPKGRHIDFSSSAIRWT